MSLVLKISEIGGESHVVSPNHDQRLEYSSFVQLIRSLRKSFVNHLKRDIYIGQPVYVYKATRIELTKAIKEFDNSIIVDNK